MIRLLTESFSPADELASVVAPKISGAVVSFTGRVREDPGDNPVIALYLEHYPGLTEKSIADIAHQAVLRWAIAEPVIVHRVGRLAPDEPIVFVCIHAAHRRDAFEAADFIMDFLKTEALFWKKEIRKDGERWIEPRNEDYRDAARWRKEDD